MKKTNKIIISSFLLLTLVGCGGKEADNTTINDDIPTVSADENEGADTSNEPANPTQNSSLPNTYKVPLKNIYVDAPAYQEIEEAYTELFIVHEQKYVAFTSDVDVQVNSVQEAHDDVFSIFQICMQNYEGGVNLLTVDTEDNKTVNGIETYYFEGSINYGKDNIHDGYAVGYAFIIDGVPCEIIGSVIDDEQSSTTIQEIKENVDAMMKSVRTTE